MMPGYQATLGHIHMLNASTYQARNTRKTRDTRNTCCDARPEPRLVRLLHPL